MRKTYISTKTDPSINLAWEEMLVEQLSPEEEVLFLWQNENTVVIGQNQNPWKECNLDLLNQTGGTLVRRKSGGGAVYHDLGNLNFTFISAYSQDTVEKNLDLILKALEYMGIKAIFHGRNDLLVGDAKVSGNAYYVENNVICHHGTLLVDVDFAHLGRILTVSHKKLESNGVDSIRSRVSNIKEWNSEITVGSLTSMLSRLFLEKENCQKEPIFLAEPSEELVTIIEKYRSWEWNYGQSPGFELEFDQRYSWGGVSLEIQGIDGCIQDIQVYTDAMDPSRAGEIKEMLVGIHFHPKAIDDIIRMRFGD